MFADNERHKNDGSSSGIKLFVVVLAILLGIAFLVSAWLFSEDIEFSLLRVTLLYGVVMPNALVIASLYDKNWKKHEHKRILGNDLYCAGELRKPVGKSGRRTNMQTM